MRQIILFETRKNTITGRQTVSGVYWFPVAATPAGSRVPQPGFQSQAGTLSGAIALTPAEQTALEDGSVREETFGLDISLSASNAQIQGELQRQWSDRAAAIAAEPPARQFYGVSWNGTSWGLGAT